MESARYAECAARQKKFWPFIESLSKQQSFWAALHDAQPAFRKIAQETGLNSFQLDQCLGDKYVDEVIVTEKTIGTSLGIQSTPTYFINEKMVVGTKFLKEELAKFFGESPAETQTQPQTQMQTQTPNQSLIPKPQ